MTTATDPGHRAAQAYALMYDSLATDAQVQVGLGKPLASGITRNYARIAARAWEAEVKDPPPQDRPWCDCSVCKAWVR